MFYPVLFTISSFWRGKMIGTPASLSARQPARLGVQQNPRCVACAGSSPFSYPFFDFLHFQLKWGFTSLLIKSGLPFLLSGCSGPVHRSGRSPLAVEKLSWMVGLRVSG